MNRRRTNHEPSSTPGVVTANTQHADLPEWLRVGELATLWRVSRTTIFSMISRGELRAHYMGRMVRIPKEQVLRRPK